MDYSLPLRLSETEGVAVMLKIFGVLITNMILICPVAHANPFSIDRDAKINKYQTRISNNQYEVKMLKSDEAEYKRKSSQARYPEMKAAHDATVKEAQMRQVPLQKKIDVDQKKLAVTQQEKIDVQNGKLSSRSRSPAYYKIQAEEESKKVQIQPRYGGWLRKTCYHCTGGRSRTRRVSRCRCGFRFL